MLTVVLISFLIAVLSGMGMGSGGLLVVFLTLLADVPQIRAQGINLLFFLFSSGASMLLHVQKRRLSFTVIAIVAAAGLIGTVPGSYAALLLPEKAVRTLFGLMLAVSGTISLFRTQKGNLNEKNAK
ncbi:MAG: sulfite exporter TauE/SafE family protein [Clostridia bacterium]|nr:sulfite exporter TauE/SafE family protein [Clostridia bacterium]